jgi:hypothetical protein
MDKRTGSNFAFRILLSIAVIFAGVLFIAGIVWVRGSVQGGFANPRTDWQEYTMPVVLLSYLPFTLLGIKRPQLASRLLFADAILTVAQLPGGNHYNGDSMSAWFFAAIGLVGLPMLMTGLLFFWR